MMFFIKDRDNDKWGDNCVKSYGNGWWFNVCYKCNLNGLYYSKKMFVVNGIIWYNLGSMDVWELLRLLIMMIKFK